MFALGRFTRSGAFKRVSEGGQRLIFSNSQHIPSSCPFSSQSQTFQSSSKLYATQTATPSQPLKRSIISRTAGFFAIAIVFTSVGFMMAAAPVFVAANEYLNPPSDEETLTMFTPGDDVAREIEEYIRNHPEAIELRSRPDFSESRPHLKIPESQRNHSLTAGTLLGPGRVAVPPFVWCEKGGKSMVSISHLGVDLCGHPGLIHGGLVATLMDEGFARCCFAALPNKVGMTANLNINYRAPIMAGSYVVLRAKTVKVEGRKAWVEGRLETLVEPGKTPAVLAEASALFIEPKQAATMARAYPVSS